MTDYSEDPDNSIAEIMIDGHIDREDFDHISSKLHAFIESQGTIKFLEDIRELKGFDPSVLFKGIRFDIEHLKHISHCAVVTDMGWVGPFSRAASAFINCEIRVFRRAELDQARQWLRSV